MITLLKIVNYDKTYVSKKDGTTKPSVDYYLELETPNGLQRVAIQQKWSNNYHDRVLLESNAKLVTVGSKPSK